MADMPFYKPLIQQQFVPRTATSYADCSAAVGGMMADAGSRGKYRPDHVDVRRNTNEPRPDPRSPGLSLQQVAISVSRLTDANVRPVVPSISGSFYEMLDALVAGKWAHVALWRGALVDAGFGGSSPFRGGHGCLYGYDQNEHAFAMVDPLTPKWLRVPPIVVARGCRQYLVSVGRGAGIGDAYYSLGPDVFEIDATAPSEEGDSMYNVAPSTTHRDVILKPNTVLYEDSALTIRYSHSDTSKKQAFGFLGSGGHYHAIVNGGQSNYVRREDAVDVVENDREHV